MTFEPAIMDASWRATMSNAMLHWDGEMTKARVTARLKALSPQARTSFGAGSLFHAYEGVRVTTECVKSGGAVVKSLDRAFGTLWEEVGHGSAHALGGPDVKDELERHAPGEDDPSLPGQADLVDGVLRLLNLRRDHKPADAFEMARFAYQAITEVVSDRQRWRGNFPGGRAVIPSLPASDRVSARLPRGLGGHRRRRCPMGERRREVRVRRKPVAPLDRVWGSVQIPHRDVESAELFAFLQRLLGGPR